MKLAGVDRRPRRSALPLEVERLAALVQDLGQSDWVLNFVMVGDREMAELNRRWHGAMEATDVLSFSYLEEQGSGPPVLRAGQRGAARDLWVSKAEAPDALVAGEVVLAPAHVARCAREGGWDLSAEWALLLAHGTLHILGWRHATPDQRQVMQAREAALLRRIGLAHPLLSVPKED